MIQQIGLFPHRTIGDNIATVPAAARLGQAADHGARRRAAASWSASTRARSRDRYPAQLSGGQRQRVGVARALAADPPLMLMDEPFGAVDPINRERLQNEFLRLQRGVRKTIVFVTHDIDEAIKMGDRIAILRKGGKLAQYAPPDELLTSPATDFVEDFVGADRALKRAVAAARSRHRPVDGAAGAGRRAVAEARAASPTPSLASRCWSTTTAARSAGSPSASCSGERVRAELAPDPSRSSSSTTSCATRSRTCSPHDAQYGPVVDDGAGRRRAVDGDARALAETAPTRSLTEQKGVIAASPS